MMEANHISVSHGSHKALQSLSFTLENGEMLGIIGANGAGKSTLLGALAGLHPLSQGEITLDGTPLAKTPHLPRRIAYLAQQAECSWAMTVEQMVALGQLPYTRANQGFILQAMREADVLHLRNRSVFALSGGERARVCLARALAVGAMVLLADEPIAGLDPAHRLQVMQMLRQKAEIGVAVACVLHDLTLAARFCHRLLLLHEGQMVAIGTPEEVLTPENICHALHVSLLSGKQNGQHFYLPWDIII